jgi:hypothetical protein
MLQVVEQHCYVILYHKDAEPHKRFKNRWIDNWRIEEILTEPWVAEDCRKAGSVYVYRCRWGGWPPCVACHAEVDSLSEPVSVPGESPLVVVRFRNAQKLNDIPPFKARPGDICKWAAPPK